MVRILSGGPNGDIATGVNGIQQFAHSEEDPRIAYQNLIAIDGALHFSSEDQACPRCCLMFFSGNTHSTTMPTTSSGGAILGVEVGALHPRGGPEGPRCDEEGQEEQEGEAQRPATECSLTSSKAGYTVCATRCCAGIMFHAVLAA